MPGLVPAPFKATGHRSSFIKILSGNPCGLPNMAITGRCKLDEEFLPREREGKKDEVEKFRKK